MIEKVIKRIAKDGAVLLITHQEDIIHVSNRAGILCGSRILREAEPGEAVKYFKNHCDFCETVNMPSLEEALKGD